LQVDNLSVEELFTYGLEKRDLIMLIFQMVAIASLTTIACLTKSTASPPQGSMSRSSGAGPVETPHGFEHDTVPTRS
jgi:hypothetical protein